METKSLRGRHLIASAFSTLVRFRNRPQAGRRSHSMRQSLRTAEGILAICGIADSKDRQIQYLLEKTSGVLTIELHPILDNEDNESRKTAASAQESRYRIALPFENLPASRLVLVTDEKTFRRNLSLRVQHSEDTGSIPRRLVHNCPGKLESRQSGLGPGSVDARYSRFDRRTATTPCCG